MASVVRCNALLVTYGGRNKWTHTLTRKKRVVGPKHDESEGGGRACGADKSPGTHALIKPT